jgi:hypothetical protein
MGGAAAESSRAHLMRPATRLMPRLCDTTPGVLQELEECSVPNSATAVLTVYAREHSREQLEMLGKQTHPPRVEGRRDSLVSLPSWILGKVHPDRSSHCRIEDETPEDPGDTRQPRHQRMVRVSYVSPFVWRPKYDGPASVMDCGAFSRFGSNCYWVCDIVNLRVCCHHR